MAMTDDQIREQINELLKGGNPYDSRPMSPEVKTARKQLARSLSIILEARQKGQPTV